MQVIDLKRNSRIKAGSIIDREYGGRSNFRQAVKKGGIGIGSLRYIDGIDAVDQQKGQDKFYKANIEFYNNGMGMYIYNVDENYLVLIGQDEIDLFRLFKPLDVIKPQTSRSSARCLTWVWITTNVDLCYWNMRLLNIILCRFIYI